MLADGALCRCRMVGHPCGAALLWFVLLGGPASSLHVADERPLDTLQSNSEAEHQALLASLMEVVTGHAPNRRQVEEHAPSMRKHNPDSLLGLSSEAEHDNQARHRREVPAPARTDMLAAMKHALEDMAHGDGQEEVSSQKEERTPQERSDEYVERKTSDVGHENALPLAEHLETVLKHLETSETDRETQGVGESSVMSALQLTKDLETLLVPKSGEVKHVSHERAAQYSSVNEDGASKSLKEQMSEKLAQMAQELSRPSEGGAEQYSKPDAKEREQRVDEASTNKDEKDVGGNDGLIKELLSALENPHKKEPVVESSAPASHSENGFANVNLLSTEREHSKDSLGDADQRKSLITQLQTLVDGMDGGHKQTSVPEAPEQQEVSADSPENPGVSLHSADSSAQSPNQRKTAGLNAMKKLIKELQNIVSRQR